MGYEVEDEDLIDIHDARLVDLTNL